MDYSGEITNYNRIPNTVPLPLGLSSYNMTGLETECPYGFVIPDHPSDPDIEWIEGTNCAIACITPLYERSGFEDGQDLIDACAWLGFIMILLNMLSRKFVNTKPMHYLTKFNFWFAIPPLIVHMIMSFSSSEQRFCRDNANTLTGRDGVTMCAVNAVAGMYCSMATFLCWGALMVHLFNQIVLESTIKPDDWIHSGVKAVIFILPLIPLVILVGSGNLGYTKGSPTCFNNQVSDDPDLDIWVFWVVAAVIGGVASICLVFVLWKAISLVMFSKIDPTVKPAISISAAYHVASSDAISYQDVESDQAVSSVTASQSRPHIVRSDGNAGEVHGDGGVTSGANGSDGSNYSPKSKTGGTLYLELSSSFRSSVVGSSAKVHPIQGASVTSYTTNVASSSQELARDSADEEREGDDYLSRSVLVRVRRLVPGMLFAAVYLVMAIGALYARFLLHHNGDRNWNVFQTWIQCIFENFYDGYTTEIEFSDDFSTDSYFDIEARQQFAYETCGFAPKGSVKFAAIVWFFVSIFGHPIVISLIYMKWAGLLRLLCAC